MVQQRLGYLIKRAQQLLRSRMDTELDKIGITTPQYAALSMLEEDPGLSNAELARRCFLTPQTMHKIVLGMADKGLVNREQDPSHGRKINTLLTEQGKDILKQAHRIVRKIESQMTDGISKEEIDNTKAGLEKCIASLSENEN